MANYEAIYLLEQRLPRMPRWARDERCQNCECAKARKGAIQTVHEGTRPQTPAPRETKHAA